MATVRMIVRMPELIPEMTGRLAKAKLAAIDTATTPATILLFLAGGIMMAMNIPYSPTLKALTTFAGRIFPINTPR